MPGRIDTTPQLRRPPQPLIDAAKLEIPKLMAGILPELDPDGFVQPDGTVVMIAGVVVAKIRNIGHGSAASAWAVHQFIEDCLLLVGPRWTGAELEAMTEISEDIRRGMRPGNPAKYPNIAIGSTQKLWDWWEAVAFTKRVDDTGKRKNIVKKMPDSTDVLDLCKKHPQLKLHEAAVGPSELQAPLWSVGATDEFFKTDHWQSGLYPLLRSTAGPLIRKTKGRLLTEAVRGNGEP